MAIISLPEHELTEGWAKGAKLASHSKLPIGINGWMYMAHNELKRVEVWKAKQWLVYTSSLK